MDSAVWSHFFITMKCFVVDMKPAVAYWECGDLEPGFPKYIQIQGPESVMVTVLQPCLWYGQFYAKLDYIAVSLNFVCYLTFS